MHVSHRETFNSPTLSGFFFTQKPHSTVQKVTQQQRGTMTQPTVRQLS